MSDNVTQTPEVSEPPNTTSDNTAELNGKTNGEDNGKVKRSHRRSANHPKSSLKECLNTACKIHSKEGKAPLQISLAVSYAGYSPNSGPGSSHIASMRQYGFLERVSDGVVRLTDAAMQAMFPDSPEELHETLWAMLRTPKITAELAKHFELENLPSDTNLTQWLARHQRLTIDAAQHYIKGLRESVALCKGEDIDEVSEEKKEEATAAATEGVQSTVMTAPKMPAFKPRTTAAVAHPCFPLSTGKMVTVVSAEPLTFEEVDELIEYLTVRQKRQGLKTS